MILISPEPFEGKVIHKVSAWKKQVHFIVCLALGISLKYATSLCDRAATIYFHYLLINV